MGTNGLIKFFFEAGFLKNVPRSGWFFIGKNAPESVAEHSFRTAVMGYLIAKKEGADADKVMKICLLHDFHETRIGDFNKVNKRYLDPQEAEKKSFSEAMKVLDDELKSELINVHSEFGSDSVEGIISKDADYLECAMQAKEYVDQGNEIAWDWVHNAGSKLQTQTAKKLFEQLQNANSTEWWRGLKSLN